MTTFEPATKQMNPIANASLLSDYFEFGKQECISPFLQLSSRSLSTKLHLKASLLGAIFLILAFALSFSSNTLPFSNLLLVSVYFLTGSFALIEALEDLMNGDVNIDILMTLAAFSSAFLGSGMEGGLLLVLFSLSGSMEDAVSAKAKGAINSLHKLSPTKASVIESNGMLIEKSIQDIAIGTPILVKSGEVIPLDGVIIEGDAALNLAHLTGENLPVFKTIGDEVPAGGTNTEGAITIRVNRTSAHSTLARIIDLITHAQEARPKLQRFFDRLSEAYAKTIISLAVIFTFTLPYLLSIPILGHEGSLYRALAFLIAASPCALIIAIPIAYLSAISACASRGILLKGGITLDAIARCEAIAFDKTGTITTGELSLIAIEALWPNLRTVDEQIELTEVLSIASALENNAIHPIARAIVSYAKKQKIAPCLLVDFKATVGQGLKGVALLSRGKHEGKHEVIIGRPAYIAATLADEQSQALLQRAAEVKKDGEIIAALKLGNSLYLFRFTDTMRKGIANTIQTIVKRGWQVLMLTGDHEESARRVAGDLGLTEYICNMTPEEKLAKVALLSEQKGLVMIGDGINDAPALARATVGICMGKIGSTTATEAADVVLLRDNIELLDWLIGKAKDTQKIVRQNLTLATLAILIASLPALGGIVPLWLAVILHEGGTVLVGLNALRLLRKT